MKAECICRHKRRRTRVLDVINNVLTFINAIGIAFLALCVLNMQDQIRTLFNREGDTAIKVSAVEKTLESREKIFSDHIAWSLKHIKHKQSSTNTVTDVESTGGN